jgi:hypothetical protein
MKASIVSWTLLAIAITIAAPVTAAPVHEQWVGTYQVQIESGRGLLRIAYSPAHCGTPAACMEILFQSPGMNAYGDVESLDQDGRHLVFRLRGLAQRFDCHLIRADIPTIMGTVEWPGSRQVFFATEQGRLNVGVGVQRTVQPDGSILVIYPDGRSQRVVVSSAPPMPSQNAGSQGSVDDDQERAGAGSNVEPLIPDPPVGTQELAWLTGLNDSLLSTIARLLLYNDAFIQTYLQGERVRVRSESNRAYYRANFIREWTAQP